MAQFQHSGNRLYSVVATLITTMAAPCAAAQTDQGVMLREYEACGLTALYTVARLHGVPVQLYELEKTLGAPAPGGEYNLEQLAAAARQHGLRAEGVNAEHVEARFRVPTPAIIHTRVSDEGIDHFMVLLAIDREGGWVLDPPRGAHFQPAGYLHSRWTGNALILAPPLSALPAAGGNPSLERHAVYVTAGFAIVLGITVAIAVVISGRVGTQYLPRARRLSSIRLGNLRIALGVFAVLAAALAGGWYYFDWSSDNGSVLRIEPAVVDLGTLAEGTHTVSFRVSNVGRRECRIKRAETSCTCMTLAPLAVIPSGASVELKATLQAGRRAQNVRVAVFDDVSEAPATTLVRWLADISPAFSPACIELSAVRAGSPHVRTAELYYFTLKDMQARPTIEKIACDDTHLTVEADEIVDRAVMSVDGRTQGIMRFRVVSTDPGIPGTRSRVRISGKYGGRSFEAVLFVVWTGESAIVARPSVVVFGSSAASATTTQSRRVVLRNRSGNAVVITRCPETCSCKMIQDGNPDATEVVIEDRATVNASAAPSRDAIVFSAGADRIEVPVIRLSQQ